MRLRDATADDLATLHPLNEANVPALSSLTADELDWFLCHADYFRVGEIDGAIAGFLVGLRPRLDYSSVNYTWFNARYEDFVYVDRLAVDTGWRRRGVARALYADIERHARSVAAPLLACEVNVRPCNEASLVLHERLGFTEVGQQETEGGAKRVALMTRPVAAADAPPGPG